MLTIAPTDVNDFTIIEREWTVLYLFGELFYNGGASPYLGIHRDTGEICGLDVERDDSQIFLLNSDIDRFIRTFQKTDEMLGGSSLLHGVLSKALKEIDPNAFQRSEWRHFSSYVEADT